jgi:hypothetical protein
VIEMKDFEEMGRGENARPVAMQALVARNQDRESQLRTRGTAA